MADILVFHISFVIVDLCSIYTSLSPHLIRDLICEFPKLKLQPDWLVIWEGPDIGIGIQKVGAAAARSIWKPKYCTP